jgi:HAD superfamily hydrolase (TIGR01490 family)
MTAPARLVFSDVDETLIQGKGLLEFLDYYFAGRYGAAGARHAARVRAELAGAARAGQPREAGNRAYYRAWAGEPRDEVAAWGARWFARRLADGDLYLRGTREALRAHRREGAWLVLVSGSFPAVLDPIAADVGARYVRCTRPEVRDGLLTGAVSGEPVIGEGKRRAVRTLIRAHPHLAPADCWGYGDHVSDLPMLTEVGHPVVVGDSAELLALLPGARQLPAR